MNKRRLIPVLALSAWLAMGVAFAHGQTIFPVIPNPSPPPAPAFVPDVTSPVTITLSTANWLPSVDSTVTLTVNGLAAGADSTISLVCPAGGTCSDVPAPGYNPVASRELKTSAYRGTCTNLPSNLNPADPVPVDFTLSGNILTSLDCGGMAVIQVAGLTFVIPQDSDFDGMPDIWEARFGPASGAGSLTANADPDNDGLSSFDEYRGVMLTGSPPAKTSLHPTEADLFVAVVNPGCGAAASASLLGGGTTTYIPDLNDGRSLFGDLSTNSNLYSLRPATASDPPGPRVHPVGYASGPPATHGAVTTGEVVDDYVGCSYDAASAQLVFSPPGLGDLDRLITANAVYLVSESPLTTLTPGATSGNDVTFTAGAAVFNQTHVGGEIVVTAGGSGAKATIMGFTSQTAVTANVTDNFASTAVIPSGSWRLTEAGQKMLRCVESDDTSSTTVYATSGWTTANQAVGCTLYAKRIEKRLTDPINADPTKSGLIAKGGSRKIRVQTCLSATCTSSSNWVTVFAEGTGGLTRDVAIRRLVAELIRFYATMEWIHGGKVRATLGTCGSHDCAGTGYLVDKDLVQVIDSKTSGFNTFRIPSLANSTIRAEFKHRNP